MSVDIRDLIAHAADTALMGPDPDKLEYACADAILSALREHGLEIVPRVPTEAMLDAAEGTYWHCGGLSEAVAFGEEQYARMLAASPYAKHFNKE